MPRVSVLLASRDGARFLGEALASLAAQTLEGVEIVAVDDGSRDETPGLFESFARQHDGVRVLRTPGLGPAAARHLAALEASGEYLAIQDDDDVSRPDRLAREVEFMNDHPEVGIVGSAADILDERGTVTAAYDVPLGREAIRAVLRRAPPFVHGSVLMRRSVYLDAGGYREPFRVAEDYDLYLRMAERTALANLPDRLYAWRAHAGNTFARQRPDHLFFSALARSFAWERERGARDSIEPFRLAGSREAFLAAHPLGPRLARYWGEALVREGRAVEARRVLRRALGSPRLVPGAVAWWALSFGAGLAPRAARGRGGPDAASGGSGASA